MRSEACVGSCSPPGRAAGGAPLPLPLAAGAPRRLPPPCAPRQLLVADTETKTKSEARKPRAVAVSCKRLVGVGRGGRLTRPTPCWAALFQSQSVTYQSRFAVKEHILAARPRRQPGPTCPRGRAPRLRGKPRQTLVVWRSPPSRLGHALHDSRLHGFNEQAYMNARAGGRAAECMVPPPAAQKLRALVTPWQDVLRPLCRCSEAWIFRTRRTSTLAGQNACCRRRRLQLRPAWKRANSRAPPGARRRCSVAWRVLSNLSPKPAPYLVRQLRSIRHVSVIIIYCVV